MGTPQTGKKIGSYRIGERIGGGSMGRVWRGVDEALGRPVAVKMLRSELAESHGLLERFRVEARVLARLSHPNIATVFALLEDGDDLYLVMEYVQGETLWAHLERRGPLDLESGFLLFHQALDGIQHAHEAGVVHRDIKPSNLMLETGGLVKWIDFGIARVEGGERMTRGGGLVGTPEYMAPEQVRGEPGTVRSDVYSLGIVLYRMLTGKLPFTGEGEFDVMRAHVEAPPSPPSEHGVEIDERLEETLLRALAKDPEERFESALAFQQALVEAGAPEPVAVRAPAPTLIPDERTRPDLSAMALPEAPTAAEVHDAATVPDGMLDDSQADASQMPAIEVSREAHPAWSRAGTWLGVLILAAAFVAAVNWLAAPERTPESGVATQSTPQAAGEAAAPAVAESGESTQAEAESDAPPPAAGETRDGSAGAKPPQRSAPKRPRSEGWEIVR